MPELTILELLEKLRSTDETVEIEAKRGREIDKTVQETISAFSNEPGLGGGYILLGVVRREYNLFPAASYDVVGIEDPDKIQADLATQSREVFSSVVRPLIEVAEVDGKRVVAAYVPEANPQEKPVYIKRRGTDRGAYRRIGSTDQVCTAEDLAMFYQARGGRSHDESVFPDTGLNDVDAEAVAAYRRLRAENGFDSGLLEYETEDLLYALGATVREGSQTRLTVAGLMLFGTPMALRRHMPMARVDYIRVEGREWIPDPDKRYDSVDKLGPLLLTIPAVVAQILDDIPRSFSLAEDGVHRKDVPLVPRNVIREAVVNALMHRSYQKHQAVQIIRYTNRIELINAGYSLVPEERLGQPGSSVARNPKIAAVLHDVGFAETKGTGIRTMREAMKRANLTQPLFESDRAGNTFAVRLLVHHLLSQSDWEWLEQFRDCHLDDDEARVLVVAREVGVIDNATYRQITGVDTLTASGHLRRLRDYELLEKRGSGAATYYVPTEKLLHRVRDVSKGSSLPDKAQSGEPGIPDKAQSGEPGIPDKVRSAQADGGQDDIPARLAPAELEELILNLCRPASLTAEQIAHRLGRNQKYMVDQYLRRMVQDGRLRHIYPDQPRHMNQAYRTADAEGAT